MKPLLILIAGPYVSSTGGDLDKIKANQQRLESYALPIYQRGHIPLVSEWVTLPIVRAAGSKARGDAVFAAYQYPVAQRLLQRCDAVLRIAGVSAGADLDVATARKLGLPVFESVEDIPAQVAAAEVIL